jgi:shikimate dehydrogenase
VSRRLYFLGVDTKASAVHRVFPHWAALCGIADAELVGLDAPQGAPRARIREMVETVARDLEAAGALVTTHKVAVFEAARDLFASIHPDAAYLGEVGCIVRRDSGLYGLAVDHESCGVPLARITGGTTWRHGVLIFGGGGAGRAIALHLARHHAPRRIVVTDTSAERLADTRRVVEVETTPAGFNAACLESAGEGALVINATGLGKDRPGSPLPDDAVFPSEAIAWDLNYRGDLRFLSQARAQQVRTEDGWIYFVAGWMTILSRVFDFTLTPELLDRAASVAQR